MTEIFFRLASDWDRMGVDNSYGVGKMQLVPPPVVFWPFVAFLQLSSISPRTGIMSFLGPSRHRKFFPFLVRLGQDGQCDTFFFFFF